MASAAGSDLQFAVMVPWPALPNFNFVYTYLQTISPRTQLALSKYSLHGFPRYIEGIVRHLFDYLNRYWAVICYFAIHKNQGREKRLRDIGYRYKQLWARQFHVQRGTTFVEGVSVSAQQTLHRWISVSKMISVSAAGFILFRKH